VRDSAQTLVAHRARLDLLVAAAHSWLGERTLRPPPIRTS
jgi:hypothetical protein